jgi:DNA-binding LacI/PurR family transcriptional regulator
MARNVTIVDVARAAGVSITTVSRALNNKPDVALPTRQRILEVIAELGYAPHAQAKNLAGGKSNAIAVLYPAAYTAGFSALEFEFFLGAAQVVSRADYLFNLIFETVTEQHLLNLFRGNLIDGAILMEVHLQDWRVDFLREHGFPFVMIGHCEDNTGLSYVDLDFTGAVMLACDHLIELGHRNIGFVTLVGDARQPGYGPSTRALWGYERACRDYGLPYIAVEAIERIEDLYRVTNDMMDRHPEVTAIITNHGPGIVGIVRALEQRGLSLPQDVSVMSIISNKVAELITPPITAVAFPAEHMGRRAAQMLVAKLQDPNYRDRQILFTPRLVTRASTGPVLERGR